ncbi:VOC family protein [Saccharothrix deserti]|uniref:VOC family protein n=1 Tax=Saccharothrix deserti TaxID=2593674 RepID=UPI00131CD5CB|nr:VOC family protein [Saccharothrix deserti]
MHSSSPDGFCWFDLKARDVAATAGTLTAAFGWRAADPGGLRSAHVLEHRGFRIGGLSDLSAPVYPAGLPDHVALYLAVDDAQSRTAAAVAAGARVLVEPFDVPEQGRVATLVDPVGAVVSLWEPGGFAGWEHPDDLDGAPAVPVHRGPDPEAARAFYRRSGLGTGAASFEHADEAASWCPRVRGLREPVRTPGGVVFLADVP